MYMYFLLNVSFQVTSVQSSPLELWDSQLWYVLYFDKWFLFLYHFPKNVYRFPTYFLSILFTYWLFKKLAKSSINMCL